MRNWGAIIVMAALITLRGSAEPPDTGNVVQTIALNAARPYFIPTHSRVTTTIRFPGEIGAPDGSVTAFTEDAGKQPSEYLVTWQQGDAYLTVTPLKDAAMANLNVPFAGQTYVLYFYQVTDPLKAVAALNLVADGSDSQGATASSAVRTSARRPPEIVRQSMPPPNQSAPITPARLIGMLDRLKLVHATPAGPALVALATAMNVQVAINGDERALPNEAAADAVVHIHTNANNSGLYQILLLRAVRDRRLNCIGFVCLLRNTSDQELVFDVSSFGARAGAEYLVQRVSDAQPVLKPGEQVPAYFVVVPSANAPLLAGNDWRLSVDLVRPRLNPGAAIAGGFGSQEQPP